MKYLASFVIATLMIFSAGNALAWDSIGHRLTAAVAILGLEESEIEKLLDIIAQHPRYQADFLRRMPRNLDSSNLQEYATWVLGQAAYWPDLARGLPDSERDKYNRPGWHYIDGAWLRDNAVEQGNIYVGINSFEETEGTPGHTVRNETQANNVMTALDYNAWILSNPEADPASRAIALCWVLHLIGDIHQPLHTGSLFSRHTFRTGDRGGNAIRVGDSNLHARWDSALSDEPFDETLSVLTGLSEELRQSREPRLATSKENSADWSMWMHESRQLLHSITYPSQLIQQIETADTARQSLPAIELNRAYVDQMKSSSRMRIAQAGTRLANWFHLNLP